MTDAYKSAEVGRYLSKELQILSKIDRFGIEAILGRKTFYFGELKKMILAENVFLAYQARKNTKQDWAKWTDENPDSAKLLFDVEKMIQELDG